jgi:hypothetical protein
MRSEWEQTMAKSRIGKLPPRYSFILNPYTDHRVSKCPKCGKLTFPRKFALFIHIKDWGPLALGKTCRWCNRCELIIAHQDELEAELATAFARLAPEKIGNDYLVLGTVDRKFWKQSLDGQAPTPGNPLEQVADFKKVLQLQVDPGGWRPANE